jgi:hypothetical protein
LSQLTRQSRGARKADAVLLVIEIILESILPTSYPRFLVF